MLRTLQDIMILDQDDPLMQQHFYLPSSKNGAKLTKEDIDVTQKHIMENYYKEELKNENI